MSSKPPRIPPLPGSPSQSLLSGFSQGSNENIGEDSDVPRGGNSDALRRIFASFERAPRFSQLDSEGGRGRRVLQQAMGVMNYIWNNRDPNNPQLCFDKHDGRPGTTIYTPHRRGTGGIVYQCSLVGAEKSTRDGSSVM